LPTLSGPAVCSNITARQNVWQKKARLGSRAFFGEYRRQGLSDLQHQLPITAPHQQKQYPAALCNLNQLAQVLHIAPIRLDNDVTRPQIPLRGKTAGLYCDDLNATDTAGCGRRELRAL
jgi:hypothetical protein